MSETPAGDDTPARDEDFARLLAEYQATYANELSAQKKRLDGILGDKHWLSVGTYKESLIRRLLRARIPTQFEVGTGFVLAYDDKKRLLSRQIDVLIWDSGQHPALFRDQDFVIIPPEAFRCAIEVKSLLTHDELSKALRNLESLTQFEKFFPEIRWLTNPSLRMRLT